jgi:hypothetical protein
MGFHGFTPEMQIVGESSFVRRSLKQAFPPKDQNTDPPEQNLKYF